MFDEVDDEDSDFNSRDVSDSNGLVVLNRSGVGGRGLIFSDDVDVRGRVVLDVVEPSAEEGLKHFSVAEVIVAEVTVAEGVLRMDGLSNGIEFIQSFADGVDERSQLCKRGGDIDTSADVITSGA